MDVIENFDLTYSNSYRVGAICRKAYFPNTIDDVVRICEYKNEQLIFLGGGYNVILSKPYYEESFVLLKKNFSRYSFENDLIKAQAGVELKELSEQALQHALTGLEMFYDIPSSLGGAIVMNAGASGEEIKDVLVNVTYLNKSTLKVHTIDRSEMNFEYRNSIFQENSGELIILEAQLKLAPGNKASIKEKMTQIYDARQAKQPKEYPNAGSVFKRPKGKFVGPMIEELGLKGFTIGGAKISEKHAGFIVNTGNATGNDILSIIEYVKNKVKAEFSVDLEVEQRVI
ncbi:UDP-N-acetylmuramate dehydrogenase [Pontibacter lucknowensis]|uniref:UDP-N-acetylenolpyruvoylglucosamine reductase n=1 Tax=Pontibacter lucknowensis TaxID=1077936 RepID=A0A1N6Y6W6_9BACT|nr:UDP-N-acetylmuramate dehydrogenase [Pontibacter lucknowensis]SIR10385.1 UDP-N-acetylmuramate dehydrogenase [Pontibacter lucknowensis]